MPNKDGIVSIGFDYKKELEKMIKEFESEMNTVSNNTQLSKGMKKQFDNILAEMREFKAVMDKELSNLGSGKVNQSSFKSFKQTVGNNFKSIREDIDRLDLAVSTLNSQMDIISNGVDLSKISNDFKSFEDYVTRTNDAVENLINTLGQQGISLFSFDDRNTSDVQNTIKKIDSELSQLDKDTGAKFELFDEKQAQEELNKLSTQLVSTLELMESAKKQMENMDSSTDGFKKARGEFALLQLQAASLNDTIETLYEVTESNGIYINMEEKPLDVYEKYTDELADNLKSITSYAENAKRELSSLLDTQKAPAIKVSSEMNPNSNELATTVTIETTSSELWKKLSLVMQDLQSKLNSNPVVAPVKLVVAPTAVSSQETGNLETSSNYSKKYAKILAQTIEDAVVDLEGVYKKTFTSIMDAGVSYAKETISKIQDIFDKNLINVKFDISQEEIDKIQNFVLSNKDGKKIDISGQITKAQQEVEELNQDIKKTTTLLEETASKGNVKFDGFDKFTQDISMSIGKLEELQNILKALQNIEITLAKASGISSITEIESQWENVEKRIINATKLDGSFRKNASVGKIASEYQKYIDMGGTNSIGDIDKIKDNKDTLDTIISKAKEFAKQDLSNDSVKELSVELDGIIGKFDELISTIKTATNALYQVIKQTGVSELDKQWSSITDKFKSIADESGKINLSKQRKDIEELLVMYQRYVDMGGSHTPSDLTDNIETVGKLDKAYKKLNEVKPIDNSSTIKSESESFNQVEKSVDSLTKAIGDTKVQAINVEAAAMEDAAEREILAINAIVDSLNMIVSKLKEIKGIKIPKIKIEETNTPVETNISSPIKDTFQGGEIKQATTSEKELLDVQQQVTKEIEQQAEAQQKKWQSFQNEQETATVEKNAVAYQELLNTIEKYSEVSKRIAKNATLDGDLELAQKLENKISELQNQPILSSSQIDKSEKELIDLYDQLDTLEKKTAKSQLNTMQSDVNSYIKKLNPYTDDTKYISDFVSRVNSLQGELKGIDVATPEGVSRLKEIESEMNTIIKDSTLLENKLVKQDSKIADIISKMKIFRDSNTNMSKTQRAEIQTLIDSAEALAKNGNVTAQEIENIKRGFSGFKAEVSETNKTGLSFIDQISQKMRDMNSKFIAQFFSFQDFIRYGRQIVDNVIEIDTALTELRKVSDATEQRLTQNFKNSAATAKELGASVSDVISATSDWARMGYDVDQSEELARVTTLYTNVGDGINTEDASASLISTLQGYQMTADEAENIVDRFNEVSNNFAITSGGIGEALQRSAASFNAANTDLSKSIALVTATNEVIQNPESVGRYMPTYTVMYR